MIKKVIEIAKYAGNSILEIYNSDDFDTKIKEDKSPLTKADLVSNQVIVEELKDISDIPIVSEELYVDYDIRKNWNIFWLVDPLDGTKDFIAKNGQFTVNIALIENKKPVMGIVYAPASNLMYWAEIGKGAFKNGEKIYNTSKRTELIGSDSNFHSSKATIDFFEKHNIKTIKRFGSAVKFGKLAEGEIDIYPRLNGTREWDTAAGHIIANEAGCKVIDIVSGKELSYNKENIVNNFFIASRNDL